MIRKQRRAFTSFGVSLLLILAFVIFFQQNFKAVVVSGPSMLPTLKNGERLWASKAYWLIGAIRKNDIVVVKDDGPTGYIIKRVVYLPGDEVEWRLAPKTVRLADGPFIVPPERVYILGDNRSVSEDSRAFGPIEMSRIVGKVVVRP